MLIRASLYRIFPRANLIHLQGVSLTRSLQDITGTQANSNALTAQGAETVLFPQYTSALKHEFPMGTREDTYIHSLPRIQPIIVAVLVIHMIRGCCATDGLPLEIRRRLVGYEAKVPIGHSSHIESKSLGPGVKKSIINAKDRKPPAMSPRPLSAPQRIYPSTRL